MQSARCWKSDERASNVIGQLEMWSFSLDDVVRKRLHEGDKVRSSRRLRDEQYCQWLLCDWYDALV